LQSYVSVSETVIFENKGGVNGDILPSVSELVSVVEKVARLGERDRGGIGTCAQENGNEEKEKCEMRGVCLFLLHLT